MRQLMRRIQIALTRFQLNRVSRVIDKAEAALRPASCYGISQPRLDDYYDEWRSLRSKLAQLEQERDTEPCRRKMNVSDT